MVPKGATLDCSLLFPQLQAHIHFMPFPCVINVLTCEQARTVLWCWTAGSAEILFAYLSLGSQSETLSHSRPSVC